MVRRWRTVTALSADATFPEQIELLAQLIKQQHRRTMGEVVHLDDERLRVAQRFSGAFEYGPFEAVSIKLDDGGPILHFREIIGQHGRRFFALKFRTMRSDADEYLAKHPELMRKYQQNMKLEQELPRE